MAGGLGATKNKYVEDWGTMRENLEKTFRFNRRNLSLFLVFGVAVPVLIYKGCVSEFNRQNALEGTPARKFM